MLFRHGFLLAFVLLLNSHGICSTELAPYHAIQVDGAVTNGLRIPLIHSIEERVAFVKTVERLSPTRVQFHLDLCRVDYAEQDPLFDEVVLHLNSREAHCERINDTVFSDTNAFTKMALSHAIQDELLKEIHGLVQKKNRHAAHVKAIAGQVATAIVFLAANRPGLTAPFLARNAVAALMSAALYMGMGVALNHLERSRHVDSTPVQIDPELKFQDQHFFFRLDLPPGLSAATVVEALRSAFDRATRQVRTALPPKSILN